MAKTFQYKTSHETLKMLPRSIIEMSAPSRARHTHGERGIQERLRNCAQERVPFSPACGTARISLRLPETPRGKETTPGIEIDARKLPIEANSTQIAHPNLKTVQPYSRKLPNPRSHEMLVTLTLPNSRQRDRYLSIMQNSQLSRDSSARITELERLQLEVGVAIRLCDDTQFKRLTA